nr:hypothetical protein [Tanacetum cinerariifolium]
MTWFSRCSWCGGPFNSGNCRHYTNVSFRDEPVYDSNQNYYNQTPDFSNLLPHHNYETDSRSDTRAAFQAEFVKLQQNFERFIAQQSCLYCGGPFNGGNCPSCSIIRAGNELVHDPNPFPYDNTPDFYDNHHSTMIRFLDFFNHPRIIRQQRIAAYKGYRGGGVEVMCRGYHREEGRDVAIFMEKKEEMWPFLGPRNEKTIPLCDIISQLPPSIVITTYPLVLPIEYPEDNLILGNEELSTIPKKESDEVIKSSVEDFVLIPSESEDTSGSDSECDLPLCDDFSPIDIPNRKSMTFSNPLYDSNDDFTSSDDESLSDEDIPKDNVKIYSNPLFEFDNEYISSDVNPLFDEVLEDIESKASYDSNLDELTLLVTPLFNSNEDEFFDPGGDDDDINAFEIPLDFKDDYYELKRDVLYLESLISYDITPNLPPKVFLDHYPRKFKRY